MPLKRLLISAAAVLGLSALGLSANAAAPTASGAGHDQIAGKGKSTFTLIFRGGGFRGGGFRGGGFRGRWFPRWGHWLSRRLWPQLCLCRPRTACGALTGAADAGAALAGVALAGVAVGACGAPTGVADAGAALAGVALAGVAAGACGAPTGAAVGAVLGWGWRRAGWGGGWGRPWNGGWGWRRAGWGGGGWGWPVGVGLAGWG